MDIDKICAEIMCAFQMSIAVHKTFHEKITKIMIQNHWNSTTFCEKTDLSNKVHSDMKKLDYKPSMSTVISLCIGLEVNKIIAENLLKSAGLAFNPTDCIHEAYLYFVNHSKEFDIETCNQVLKKLGAKKKQLLGSKSDDE